jgi:type I restriction enzyme S subunit
MPKSILQMAVQGKLVSQDLRDEPASELLKRIRAGKAKLVKEGKLKEEKPLPPITEDEIPYDLPKGWVWCRLSDILHENIGGGTPSKQNPVYWNGDIHWASVKDLNCTTLTTTQDTITELGLSESTSNLIPEGNIIVCTRMGLGKIVINKIPVAINQDLRALIFSEDKIDYQYFIYWYKTLAIAGEGMTVKGIKIEELNRMFFPLAPLAEQQRIVAIVDELMAFCAELKTAKTRPVKRNENNLVPFPQTMESEEEIGIAARGDATQPYSPKLQGAINKLLAGDSHE